MNAPTLPTKPTDLNALRHAYLTAFRHACADMAPGDVRDEVDAMASAMRQIAELKERW